MKFSKLGSTGLLVSRLCFGSLTVGPLQKNLSPRSGGAVIKAAIARGVNFIDTAELYENYVHIREGCQGERDVILSSRSYAYTYEGMRGSIEKALRETSRSFIDIFGLHEQSSRLTLKGHQEALRALTDAKTEGLIRAVSVSTHFIEVVRAAAMYDEIDVIHPLVNMQGLGIADGTAAQMLDAIDFAAYMGKGVYAMKALGGGHLAAKSQEALAWVLDISGIASVAVGMGSISEAEVNCALFSGEQPDVQTLIKVQERERSIFVESYCIGCGRCQEACSAQALKMEKGRAVIDRRLCIRCGYCAAKCEHFCIKVV